MAIVSGVNPVREALKSGRAFERILVARGAGGPRLQEIIEMAREARIPIRFEPRTGLDRLAGTPAHQGVVAMGAAKQYAGLDDIAERAQLLVVLDGVEDPHNLGAIVRTANAAGADAVIIPERRAVGLTDVVAKAAAGALEYVPIVRVGNVNRALERLKELGFWIYGLDERGERNYNEVDYGSPAALVFGGEGHGLHDLVRRHCDMLVRIPMAGVISSLNVSVAAGIVMFEWRKGRKPAAG